jgi:dephospho-CoA kinase
MRIVGLTGSIGMGKSTTAAMFAEAGAPVYDADAAVHELYAKGGAAVAAVGEAFPEVVVDGAVDRARLSARVMNDTAAFKQLERIVHPLVGGHRADFFQKARDANADMVILDVPLLFETGGDRALDAVIVVSAPADLQRERVLARPGMTEDKFHSILARQWPDDKKRSHADFVIDTGKGLAAAKAQVLAVLERLRDPAWVSQRAKSGAD